MASIWQLRLLVVWAVACSPLPTTASPLSACYKDSWSGGATVLRNIYRVDDVRPCLMNYKINLHDMMTILQNLEFGQATTYSFTDIVKDSHASVQTNKCGLKVHDLNVDIHGGVRKIYDDMVTPEVRRLGLDKYDAGLSAEKLHQLLTQDSKASAWEFHSRLHKLFVDLNDAHTSYSFLSRAFIVLPVTFNLEPCTDANATSGDQLLAVTASRASESESLMRVPNSNAKILSSTRAYVMKINGGPPLDFLQAQADAKGNVHDRGQRINQMIMSTPLPMPDGTAGMLGFNAELMPENETTVEILFSDGSTQKVDWLIGLDPNTVDGAITVDNPAYEALQKMEAQRAQWYKDREAECKTIPGCDAPAVSFDFTAARAYRQTLGHIPDHILQEAAFLRAKAVASKVPAEVVPHLVADPFAPLVPISQPPLSRAPLAESVISPVQAPVTTEPKPLRKERRMSNSSATYSASLSCRYSVPSGVSVPFSYSTPPSSELVTVSFIGDMAVFKLTGMGGSAMDFEKVMEGYVALVKGARQKGIKRVLIDLISNGGGLVLLSDMLQSLFLKQPDPTKLCNLYDKRVSQYWWEWTRSFGDGLEKNVGKHLDDLTTWSTTIPEENRLAVVQWYLKYQFYYLKGILDGANALMIQVYPICAVHKQECIKQGILVDADQVQTFIDTLPSETSAEQVLTSAKAWLLAKKFVPRSLFGNKTQGTLTGWFPFTGEEIVDKDTGKIFPNMGGVLDPEHQDWGGVKSNYSKKGIFYTCWNSMASDEGVDWFVEQNFITDDSTASDLKKAFDHPFEDISILTDGNAGSAGSSFPSKLMATGYVTIFTYGGRGDANGIDSSAFAGGNVLDYNTWWTQTAIAAELGMWLVPNSSWEKYSEGINATKDGRPTYPYPMPLTATSDRFNFNMMYVREFSDESSLPRQFYRLPAHKHYSQWPRLLHETCDGSKYHTDLLKMYKNIHDEDWWAVRSKPQYLNNGWAESCVPPKEKQCCCGENACTTPKARSWPSNLPSFSAPITCPKQGDPAPGASGAKFPFLIVGVVVAVVILGGVMCCVCCILAGKQRVEPASRGTSLVEGQTGS